MLTNVLTPNVIKQDFFQRDGDYTAALRLVREFWQDQALIIDQLWNCAALVLRPDAIAGRRAATIFPVLRQQGFVPIAVRAVSMNPSGADALWRYQFNVATPQRRRLLRRIMNAGKSIYVILRDVTIRAHAPATVHLTYLKGTAIVGRRNKVHLRTIAGPAVANILSYIHMSDDPADMLREMAVMFDERGRIQILSEMATSIDRTATALELIRQLEAAVPYGVLDFDRPLGADLDQHDDSQRALRSEWVEIVAQARRCQSFISGESYRGRDATIPDDPELSLPLDGHLIRREFGYR